MPAGTMVPDVSFTFDIELYQIERVTRVYDDCEACAACLDDEACTDPGPGFRYVRSLQLANGDEIEPWYQEVCFADRAGQPPRHTVNATTNPLRGSSGSLMLPIASPDRGQSTDRYEYREVNVGLTDLIRDELFPHPGVFVFRVTERWNTNDMYGCYDCNCEPCDCGNNAPGGCCGTGGDCACDIPNLIVYSSIVYYLYVYVAYNQPCGYCTGCTPWLAIPEATRPARPFYCLNSDLGILGIVSQQVRRGLDGVLTCEDTIYCGPYNTNVVWGRCNDCVACETPAVNCGVCEDCVEGEPICPTQTRPVCTAPVIVDGTPCDYCLDAKHDSTPGRSDMVFRNDFIRTYCNAIPCEENPEDWEWDPNDPDCPSSLYVAKVVTGNLGDQEAYFRMSMRLLMPDLLPRGHVHICPGMTCTTCEVVGGVLVRCPGDDDCDHCVVPFPTNLYAFIVNGDGTIVRGDDAEAGNFGSLPTGVIVDANGRLTIPVDPVTREANINYFYLRHLQRLLFVQVPMGTFYVVNEYYVADYEQTGVYTSGGVSSTRQGTTGDGADLNLRSAESRECTPDGEAGTCADGCEVCDNGFILVSEIAVNNNSARINNHRETTPPMGVFLNNLPFIGLIALAVGGLVGFVVLKVRKTKRVEVVYE